MIEIRDIVYLEIEGETKLDGQLVIEILKSNILVKSYDLIDVGKNMD